MYDNTEEIEAESAREDEAEASFEERRAEVLAESTFIAPDPER